QRGLLLGLGGPGVHGQVVAAGRGARRAGGTGRDRGDAEVVLVLERGALVEVGDLPRALDDRGDLAVDERVLDVGVGVGGGVGLVQALALEQAQPGAVGLHGLGRLDGDLLGVGVDRVGALAVGERLGVVGLGGAPVAVDAGLVLDGGGGLLQVIPGLGSLDAGLLEEFLVVDEGQGVRGEGDAVGLALVLGLLDQVRLELVLVGEGLGAV